MSELPLTDERLRQFLLGQLDDRDRETIERACLDPDDTTFAEVSAAEDDLRTDYALGLLTGDDRERFRARYLADEAGAERQAFVAALVARSKAPAQSALTPSVPSASSPLHAPAIVWWRRPTYQTLIAAAALVLAALSAVMLGTVHGLQRRVVRLTAEAQPVTTPSTSAPAPTLVPTDQARLQDALTREQARAAELERRLADATAKPAGPLLALWLTPGLTRAPGAEVPRVTEADVTRGLRVTLTLPATQPPADAYQVVVRDADGRSRWSSSELAAADRSVTATVPASILTRGDYELVLRGRTGREPMQDAASYPLRVVLPR